MSGWTITNTERQPDHSRDSHTQKIRSRFPEPQPFLLFDQDCQLLPEGEVLGRKFRAVTRDPTNEQHKDANQPRFTASENPDSSPETIAEPPKASNRKSLVDKQFGINDRDR